MRTRPPVQKTALLYWASVEGTHDASVFTGQADQDSSKPAFEETAYNNFSLKVLARL